MRLTLSLYLKFRSLGNSGGRNHIQNEVQRCARSLLLVWVVCICLSRLGKFEFAKQINPKRILFMERFTLILL